MKNNILYEIPAVDNVVDSYWFKKYESGVKHLLVNTATKWGGYLFQENNFSKNEIHEPTLKLYTNDYELTFSEELQKLFPKSGHICVTSQEKDQISIYWIPFNLIK